MQENPPPEDDDDEEVRSPFRSLVTGVLNGFDRLMFRGFLRSPMDGKRMVQYLRHLGVDLPDFGAFVERTTEQLEAASLREAYDNKRPVLYLESSAVTKDDVARRLLAEHPIDEGLVCDRVSPAGRLLTAGLFAALSATLKQLMREAA